MLQLDNDMSNLERLGFAREVTDSTWNYKLDTNPIKPQANIKATDRCEFWVMDIDLVKPTF